MSETIEQIRDAIRKKQIDRIHQLVPGRRLDALIAHYLMGYHVEQWVDEQDSDYWYHDGSNRMKIQNQEDMQRVPNYSTMIYSASLILEKFANWQLEGNENKGVQATLYNNPSMNISSERCGTLSEAICKAALIGLVAENKLMEELLSEEE